MLKRTPLYQQHLALQAKMVPFAGFEMPVEYKEGLAAEHLAVRRRAGLFDVSHMGEFELKGEGAKAWLNRIFTNAFDSLKPGRVRYTVLCNEEGFCLDDLIVYCLAEDHFLLVVNAANREKDFAWLREHTDESVTLEDVSDDFALLALQGPESETILRRLSEDELPKRYYSFLTGVKIAGIKVWAARTGYTGEHGYELFVSPEAAEELWCALTALKDDQGRALVTPCGLGARDTLRLEAGMPLYGHEMDESITPLEAGLDFAVKTQKDFIGAEALRKEPQRERIGLKVTGRGIVREESPVFFEGEEIGVTTSGTYVPYLEEAVAMALVKRDVVKTGDKLEAQVRKRRIEVEVTELPFYKAKK